MNNRIIGHMKKRGFRYQKDIQGHYFDKGNIKLSVMVCGPVWNCFCNKMTNGQYMLTDKLMNAITDEIVYNWLDAHSM